MCGIAAIWGNPDQRLLRDMMARMKHRGPDGEGVLALGRTLLGHVRLAIVDVAAGSQPMTNERGDLAVSFNGEIYNHLDLRRALESRHAFKTRSDTEVLLHLYEEEGLDMLPKLDGMFAFALVGTEGMVLARDPLGIKPLYYGYRGDSFLAASEICAFSPMDELHALPAGHLLQVGGARRDCVSFVPSPDPSVLDAPLPEVLEEIRRLLTRAVIKRLMSDGPVGVYLSGGLDSSLVAALMRPHVEDLHTFTAGVDGAPDLDAAREVAEFLGTQHHELVYSEQAVEQAVPEVIRRLESFDAPLVRSAIPMYFVSKLASRHVKVVLTGEGADELFAGYAYLSRFPDRARLREELADITLHLQDTNLQRADRMTMAHGVEGRVPFLDMDLVRFVTRLPVELIEPRPDRPEKWLLREACQGLLPESILNRKKLKFSEGAGSARVMEQRIRARISKDEFERERHVHDTVMLRSAEELFYYRIWREGAKWSVSPRLVGRTKDSTAALEV